MSGDAAWLLRVDEPGKMPLKPEDTRLEQLIERACTLTPLTQVRIFERDEVPGYPPPGSEQPSGYGLLVAKAFIERMHGRICSESKPGKSACFSFWIPYQPGLGDDPQ